MFCIFLASSLANKPSIGGAQALRDIMSGRVQLMIDGVTAMRGLIDGGQIKPLGGGDEAPPVKFS